MFPAKLPPPPLDPGALRALTLDLDDTLWPIGPTLAAAEATLAAWLRGHAPATAARFPPAAMLALRHQVGVEHPGLAHDLSALRRLSLETALRAAGDDPALAGPAFEVYFEARQRITLHPEVPAALDRLAARWPLLALSNGNAELGATGVARWFVGSLSAREAGVAKPAPAIFAAACARLGAAPGRVLHAGDDWHSDVLGARRAGLRAAWLQRPGGPSLPPHGPPPLPEPEDAGLGACWAGPDLQALAEALGA